MRRKQMPLSLHVSRYSLVFVSLLSFYEFLYLCIHVDQICFAPATFAACWKATGIH